MSVKSDTKNETADALLSRSLAREIEAGEIVRAAPYPNSPISVRLGAALLEKLDRLAEREHRTRGNLIQHILWEYVRARESS